MKIITDTMTTPPGGWRYKEPSTGIYFEDISYQGIITRIRQHKDACGITLEGEWVTEVQQVMIEMNPQIRHEEAGSKVRKFGMNDVVRFIETMKRLGAGALVSEEEQARRADICAVCPQNGVINCKYCGWLATQITGIMGGRSIPKVNKLYKKSCLACGCDLTAKTACPTDVLKQVDAELKEPPVYDSKCWMLDPAP